MFGRIVGNQILKRVSKGKVQSPNRVQAMLRLPTLLRLGYGLMRDERVPMWQRAGVVGALAVIFSPIDIPSNIPVVGQFWDFTLAVTVLDAFLKIAPAAVVNEHITRLGLEKKIPLRQL